MTDYDRLRDALLAIGAEVSAGECDQAPDAFHRRWYQIPKHIVTATEIDVAGAVFYFDNAGSYVGCGSGDEQPDFCERREVQ